MQMKTLLILLLSLFISSISISQTAEEYYDRGNDRLDRQDYRGAIANFSRAIEINPRYEDAYFNRGVAKINLYDYYGAIADFKKVTEINPRNADAYFRMGALKYLITYSNFLEKMEGLNESIRDLTKAIEINPKFARAFYFRGLVKIERNQQQSGCLDLSRAGELGYEDAYDEIRWRCR